MVLWVVAALLLATVLAGYSFWIFSEATTAAKTREQSHLILNRADDLMSALKEAETGQRGFLLTGNEVYLEPYEKVRASIKGELADLRQLTTIEAANAMLDAVGPLIDARLVSLSSSIALRRSNDMAAVIAFVSDGEGKRQMDSIRAGMKAYVVIEEHATQQNDAKFLASMGYLFNLIVAASLIVLLSALYFVYTIYWRNQQQLAQRAHAETTRMLDLQQQLNQALEEKNAALKIATFEAEKADRTKSEFLATMSHEIRTPMNGVIGMIDVLQQSSLNGAQLEMTNIIHDSAFALLAVINDILDFSKIEANKLDVESIPMSVSDVVESACDNLAQMALAKQVDLTLFVDPAIPTAVLGDPGRLRQILINLTTNAIKFSTGPKRTGRVSVRVLLKEHTTERVMLTFRVTDNGIGMDPATRARLFNAFTQADTSTTRNFGGTGLGLAISAQLSNLMGGDIEVDSRPGEGSVFSLNLPFVLGSEPSERARNPNLIDALPCLVMTSAAGLADDLAVYLRAEQALVSRAADLAGALTWMQAHPGGLCVVVETADPDPVLASLRAAARAQPEKGWHFLCLRSGQRRKPRTDQTGLVTVDGNLLNRKTFLRAAAIAAGRAEEPGWDNLPAEACTTAAPISREQARLQGSLILVAEDNEYNQKVILQQLMLLGRTADIANNGQEALARWQGGAYALLITDLHMPLMDGYELTAAIRAAELGKPRLPIIAFTANALKGEAERCKAIGMDDYLSKPVQLAELKAMLKKWQPVVFSVPIAGQPLAVDVRVLAASVGDDAAVNQAFLTDFHTCARQIGQDIHTACRAGDALAAGDLAHQLKSAARSVGALALGELCATLELAGKAGDEHTLALLLPAFDKEWARVDDFLRSDQPLESARPQTPTQLSAPLNAEPLLNTSRPHILVLDDEPFMRNLLARMLANLGHDAVSTCGNGQAALALLDTPLQPPDLILLDINMPQMDGIEFVRHLVDHHYRGALILVSGENERVLQSIEKLVQAHNITVLGYLSKPVLQERLAALINNRIPHFSGTVKADKKVYGEAELRAAIADGNLVNYYQPKVSLASGAVVGAETLVRWLHTIDGLVMPDQFIGLAEQYGLIDALTHMVLVSALPQARQWQDANLSLRLAVNLSMDNLLSLSFLDEVVNLTAQAGVHPENLMLEVTESRLMQDQRVSLEILTRLRLKRFKLSIDDFGTGNSSLTQLRNIPFDELKIDQTFVHGAWANGTQRAMFDASLGLARQLGMQAVAEGVEDQADWDFLRQQGCDVAQGYFIARPMPAEQFIPWMQQWEKRRPALAPSATRPAL